MPDPSRDIVMVARPATAQVEEMRQREAAVLADLGVEQALFDTAQSQDKFAGDGQFYAFLAPGPQTFAQHGIANVTGTQSRDELDFLAVHGLPIRLTD